MRLRFGDFLLDDESFRLTRAGHPVAMRRKVFDLLVVLVRERERVVLREELVERLWSTTAVGAGSLSGLVNELRAALDEGGRGRSSIRTVHARGYQFVAAVGIELAEEAGDGRGIAPVAESRSRGLSRAWVRLERARREVMRSGARAVAAVVVDPAERRHWVATMLAEACEAGFQTRFESVACNRLDHPLGDRDAEGSALRGFDSSGMKGAIRSEVLAARMPIALGLEVHEPEAWFESGGLLRLLDLLGRAPVLVVAALATQVGDRDRAVLGGDARIQWTGAASSFDAQGQWIGDEEAAAATPRAGVVGILGALARADGAAFEAALRGMGYEAARIEPVRSLRRVEPAARGPARRLRSERT